MRTVPLLTFVVDGSAAAGVEGSRGVDVDAGADARWPRSAKILEDSFESVNLLKPCTI